MGFILFLSMVMVAIVVAGVVYCFRCEVLLWNDGICPDCNSKWDRLDADIKGGRVYKCLCGNHIIIFTKIDEAKE